MHANLYIDNNYLDLDWLALFQGGGGIQRGRNLYNILYEHYKYV